MRKELSIKEALEDGYSKCGYDHSEWQSLLDIDEVDETDLAKGNIVLFTKDAYHPSIDAEIIKDLLAEHISCNHEDETGDDTRNVEDSVRELDFEATAKMINDKLSSVDYWKSTYIYLIP